jgi:hypothetical protein
MSPSQRGPDGSGDGAASEKPRLNLSGVAAVLLGFVLVGLATCGGDSARRSSGDDGRDRVSRDASSTPPPAPGAADLHSRLRPGSKQPQQPQQQSTP